tara:strand:+ start:4260 stop:4910 length:651 start_codon:yes stop_codon:yes gene_type:complete
MKCEYCNKTFKRESSLTTHICEKKRRWFSKDYPETIAGFTAYDLFYRMGMQGKPRQYTDFVDSQYFSSFIKFGSYCINTKVIDAEGYTRWLIRKQAKLKDWATDSMYSLYVQDHLKKETVDRALERFIESAAKLENFDTFWETSSGYFIADWVESGKISPWILICSNRAQDTLNRMNAEQFDRIAGNIDASYWGKKTQQNPVDADWVRQIIDGNTK